MPDYFISEITSSDTYGNRAVDALLQKEGIRRDSSLDYTCGIYDQEMKLIATGSCFSNTLRCMAVSSEHQGEGLMNQIVSHLVSTQVERGNTHIFLYTKCESARFFQDLGFYEIVRINEQIVFMENRRTGFRDYLTKLQKETLSSPVMKNQDQDSLSHTSRTAALVMNANPFTLGHQYLAEKASRENDVVHLFMVSEDSSLIPFSVRKRLIIEGTAHLRNIVYHESGPYIISSATFPSYFQKDSNAVMESHARLDLSVFTQIAEKLSINCRYVGQEPTSQVTDIYNQIMKNKLPEHGIECIILPRREAHGQIISASSVRQALKDGNDALLKEFLPETTLNFFKSQEASEIIKRISACDNVIHH